ncbi:MAG: hypothetical protein BroJett029_24500 [Alphaproteobacteria bacterium]|nr:MAG: hypothetical protein BroJett029_24500 [Alphaproteobacteria bacterium]
MPTIPVDDEAEPRTSTGRIFTRGRDAVEWVTETALTERESEEIGWYERLRLAMRDTRESAGKLQAEIAAELDKTQSEISRLERGVGPATGIGRIKSYVEACGGRFGCVVIDARGEVILDELGRHAREVPSSEPQIDIAGGALTLGEMRSLSLILEGVNRELIAEGLDTRKREEILNRSLRSVARAESAAAAPLKVSGF